MAWWVGRRGRRGRREEWRGRRGREGDGGMVRAVEPVGGGRVCRAVVEGLRFDGAARWEVDVGEGDGIVEGLLTDGRDVRHARDGGEF